MKREEFIRELKRSLQKLPNDEVAEIVMDQEEYIREAVRAGRIEDEVVNALGDPKVLAASFSTSAKIESAERATTLKSQIGNTLDAVIAILALAPLNLIFVLGPFLFLVAFLISFWVSSIAVAIASVFALLAFIVKVWFLHADFWNSVSLLFLILTGMGAGGVGILLMVEITKIFTGLTLQYLKWNLNFIQRKKHEISKIIS